VTDILDQGSRSLPHQNLAATLEAVFSAHHQDLAALHEATRPKPIPLDADAVLVAPPGASPKARQQSAQSRARRLAIYEQVWALHRQGLLSLVRKLAKITA
jgi:hypothetical protein